MNNTSGQYHERYHIIAQLGEGGMATVYKAYDIRLEREVALKVIRRGAFPPDQLDGILARFEREAKSLARLSHPNIVKVYDFGEHDGAPYLVMEYLPGGTLKTLLGRPIPWAEAGRLLLPVARGLAFAHERGIIHRDVKPANIIISEAGEPMLTDFGIAKLLEKEDGKTLTASGVGIGTPEYMAPEQGLGQGVDARADIYSLGVVLYEMVTGRKPYVADTPMAVVLKQISDPLPRPQKYVPELPAEVEYLLVKAMAKKPEDRFENMGAFCQALEELLGAASQVLPLPASAPGTNPAITSVRAAATAPAIVAAPTAHAVTPPARRVPVYWLALLGVFILLGAGGAFFLLRGRPGPDAAPPPATLPLEPTRPTLAASTAQPTVSKPTAAPTRTLAPTVIPPTPVPPAFTPPPTLDASNATTDDRRLEVRFMVGLLKLEGSRLALTQAQATALLPLVKDFRTLNQSLVPPDAGQAGGPPPTPVMNPTAQAQKDTLIAQMQALLTPAQIKAIAGMKLTPDTIASVIPQTDTSTPQAGGRPTVRQPGSGGGLMGDLVEAFLRLLTERAGQ